MNDFTKDELECLLSDHWSCGANFPGLYDKLNSMKIKAMIEDYSQNPESPSDMAYLKERRFIND